MIVTRVHDARGSHIEPPFDECWSDGIKLTWMAAVVTHDTGLPVTIHGGARLDREGRPIPGWYSVNVGACSIAAYNFREAWVYLTGVSTGATQQARHATA